MPSAATGERGTQVKTLPVLFERFIAYLEAERRASRHTVREYQASLMDFFDFLRAKHTRHPKEVDRALWREYLNVLRQRYPHKCPAPRH